MQNNIATYTKQKCMLKNLYSYREYQRTQNQDFSVVLCTMFVKQVCSNYNVSTYSAILDFVDCKRFCEYPSVFSGTLDYSIVPIDSENIS